MFKESDYKFILQKKGYDCGVAATAMLLLNTGSKRVDYDKLSIRLSSSRKGVLSDDIVKYIAKFRKHKANLKTNSTLAGLRKELDKGKIVMVMYQGWAKHHEVSRLQWGHYAIAIKMTTRHIYLLDPGVYRNWGQGIGWRKLKLTDFRRRWVEKEKGQVIKDWMLSIAPKKKYKN